MTSAVSPYVGLQGPTMNTCSHMCWLMVVFVSSSSRFDFLFATATRDDSSIYTEAATSQWQMSTSKSCSGLINREPDANRESVLIRVILTSNLYQLLLWEIAARPMFCSGGCRTSAGAGSLPVQSILFTTTISFDFMLVFFYLISSAFMTIWLSWIWYIWY